MNEAIFQKLMLICYNLFIKDQNIAECLDDFPNEITEELVKFVSDNYESKFKFYYRFLTKADKDVLVTQSLRAVLKDFRRMK